MIIIIPYILTWSVVAIAIRAQKYVISNFCPTVYTYGMDASKLSSKLRATMLLSHKNYRVTVELAT